jgi:hypothetical protein
MKGFVFVLGCLASFTAHADDPILQPLAHVTTDAVSGMYCDLSFGLAADNTLLGVEYDCHGNKEYKDFYPIDKIRQGVVLYHYDALNVDVVSVSAPNLDVAKGGPVVFKYLSNYLGGEYKTWEGEAVVQGTKWIAYTSPDNGNQPFNNILAKKRTVLGQIVGISEIDASWTNN